MRTITIYFIEVLISSCLYLVYILNFNSCDQGYVGDDCNPTSPMDTTMQADFGIRYQPDVDFLHIWGGEVTNGDKGCGTLFSGETLYFSGVRLIYNMFLKM
jgi:hypothetical protein